MILNPIKVKKYKAPIHNPRQILIEEENDKIKGKKGIILKGYKTERERIQKQLEENKFLSDRSNVKSPIKIKSKKKTSYIIGLY